MSLKALIFDLDGVLTDTAKYHYLAWKKLADELGMKFTEKDNELLKDSYIKSWYNVSKNVYTTTNITR